MFKVNMSCDIEIKASIERFSRSECYHNQNKISCWVIYKTSSWIPRGKSFQNQDDHRYITLYWKSSLVFTARFQPMKESVINRIYPIFGCEFVYMIRYNAMEMHLCENHYAFSLTKSYENICMDLCMTSSLVYLYPNIMIEIWFQYIWSHILDMY